MHSAFGLHSASNNPIAAGSMSIAPDAAWLWTAFVDESSVPTFVVSRDGVVEYANLPASTLLAGQAGVNVVGKSLNELIGQDHATERLTHIATVLDTGRSLAIEDMLRGKRLQCVLRLCPAAKGERPSRVIAVAHLSALYAGALNGYPVVRARTMDGGRLKNLTTKELEILRLISLGLSTQEIADTLGRSVKTVEWHRVSLGQKLGAQNRVLLARIAIAAGLVGLDEPPHVPTPHAITDAADRRKARA